MRCLVGEEGDLREQDAEDTGDDELEPAVTQQDEAGDRSAEAERDRGADDDVEPRRALEQSGLTHDLRNLRVRLSDRREAVFARVRLAYGVQEWTRVRRL